MLLIHPAKNSATLIDDDEKVQVPKFASSHVGRVPTYSKKRVSRSRHHSFKERKFLRMKLSVPDQFGQVHATETPELLETKLRELDSELTRRNHPELCRAQKLAPAVYTDSHKLKFLRADVFRVPDAASRLCNYWEMRVNLFGEDRAFQPLDISTASPDDRKALSYGYVRIMPKRDRDGRAIVLFDSSRQDKTQYPRESMTRAVWLMMHEGLRDSMVQKKGIVLLGNFKNTKTADRELAKQLLRSIQGCVPVRLAVYHICNLKPIVRLLLPFLMLFVSTKLRKRLNFHFGSDSEITKALMASGLSEDLIPTDIGGKARVYHEAWLQECLNRATASE